MLTYIIDDEPISLFLTEQVLRHAGFRAPIRTFSGADKALQFMRAHLATEVPELLLLDLNMPGMNGWEFLESLAPHAAALAGRCHLFILTSSLALTDTDRAKDFPLVCGVIHKPLNEDEVQGIQHTAKQF